MRLAVGAWLGGLTCISAWAQEPATSGVTPSDSVLRVDDPLRQRSATENTVFGQIVSSDDHRLTIIEGEGDNVVESEFIYGPGIKVFIDERPSRLQDIPAKARIKVFRDAEDPNVITDVVVLPDEPGAPAGEPAVPEAEPALIDSTSPVGFGMVLEGTPQGLMVASVRADGPADKAGVEGGDEIVALDDKPVGLPDDILAATARMEDGATVTMTIRRDGTERNVSLIAEKGSAGKDTVRTAAADTKPTTVLKQDAPEVSTEVTPDVDLGATLATDTEGVAVVRLSRASPLARAGVVEGDLIQKAAGKSVLTPESLFRILNEFDGGAQVELAILRDEREIELTMALPADHKRVLVNDETSTAGAVNPDRQRIGAGDRTGRTATVEELQQVVARQQEQINWLYNALMEVADATGVSTNNWGGWPAALPFGFSGVVGGAGTGVLDANGDGLPDQDSNGDGIIDEDSDGDGVIDDVNGDGAIDEDIDSDGILDTDRDGDGVIDPSGQRPADTTPLDRLPPQETGVDLPGNPIEVPTLRNGNRRNSTPPRRPTPTAPQKPVTPNPGTVPPGNVPGQVPPAGGATPSPGRSPSGATAQ